MSQIATIPDSPNQMQALVPRSIAEALQLADVLAQASLIPEHLQKKPGDCLLVVMQAQRWGMDALSVAQCTSIVRGKLCYEGKLVAAVLYSMGAIQGRLRYEFAGSGEQRSVTVTGKPRGLAEDQSVTGTVADWKTNNDAWKRSSDDMLVYRGTRQWARRYAPEALLGVYTPDEFDETAQATAVQQDSPRAPAGIPDYDEASFVANFPKWEDLVRNGRKTPDAIIDMVSTKAKLSAEQAKKIRALKPDAPIEGEFQRVDNAQASGDQA